MGFLQETTPELDVGQPFIGDRRLYLPLSPECAGALSYEERAAATLRGLGVAEIAAALLICRLPILNPTSLGGLERLLATLIENIRYSVLKAGADHLIETVVEGFDHDTDLGASR